MRTISLQFEGNESQTLYDRSGTPVMFRRTGETLTLMTEANGEPLNGNQYDTFVTVADAEDYAARHLTVA